MQTKISLLMANYNNAPYIKNAIESVLNQSSTEWELVIVDDLSIDNSLEIIQPYLKDERIKLFKHQINKGCGATKRTCAENANGEIFGILDPDDALHKDAVKIMVKAHQDNPDCGLIYSTYYKCDKNLKTKYIAKSKGLPEKGKTHLHNPMISHFATFKKAAYVKTEGFNPKLKKAVDKDIYYKLEEVTKLKFINKPLYYYRIHEDGISQGKHVLEAQEYSVLASHAAYKRRLNTIIPNLRKKELSDLYFGLGYQYLEHEDNKKAKTYLLKAIMLNPLKLSYVKTYIKRICLKVKID